MLEDLSFKYINPKKYDEYQNLRNKLDNNNDELLNEMINSFKEKLDKFNISATFRKDVKNIYGIYKRISDKTKDASDILEINIVVDNIQECYQVLGVVHSLYKLECSKFRDYISNPKTNLYQAIHTTVYTDDNVKVQVRIKTKEMDDLGKYGIMKIWSSNIGCENLQRYLVSKFPFVNILREINQLYPDNLEFMKKLEHDVLKDKIYVIIGNGNIVELPSDTSLEDLCKKLDISYERLLVNNEVKPINYVLENNDVISAINVKVK